MTQRTGPGRRPASSRATLEESAGELFLERGYAATTIGEIARRAGVSRNTFFNYFEAKSDVLWGDVDDAVGVLADELRAVPGDEESLAGLAGALARTAARFGPDRIPLAATQYETMGARDEITGSALPRFLALAAVVERYLIARGRPDPEARPLAYAVVAAAAAAAVRWARAGVARGALATYLDRAVAPILRGHARDD